jgi:hypothetical protein
MIMAILLPWCIMLGQLAAGEGDQTLPVISEHPNPFVLTVHEGLISLRAQQASLKAIIEELGRRLNIEVVAQISPGEHVTLTFKHLSLEETIQRLRQYARITYTVKDAERKPREITSILLLPKQEGGETPGPVTAASEAESPGRQKDEGAQVRPAPFKFHFDPSQSLPNKR